MKKSISVNISGSVFHIDEDAYDKLNTYLKVLHNYFDKQPDGKEIVNDIESRIAELLHPQINTAKQSITVEDIENLINTLGKPEDITGEDNTANNGDKTANNLESTKRTVKKLYRDKDNAVIGGVCSGIAAYFDTDPIFIRIIFLVLFFTTGVTFIIYPILWIALPAARTSAQKLEMHGESVTINNIERSYHNQDRNQQNSSRDNGRETGNYVSSLPGRIVFGIWRICSFFIGMLFIVLALILMISLIAAIFFNSFYLNDIFIGSTLSVRDFLNILISPQETSIILFIILLIIIIPLIGLVYAGLKLIIRFKVKDTAALISMFVLWIIAVITGAVLISSDLTKYRATGYVHESKQLAIPKCKTLYIKVPSTEDNNGNYYEKPFKGFFGIETKDNKTLIWGVSSFYIDRGEGINPGVEIIKEARGITIYEASEAARQIKVNLSQTDSVITLDPKFWIFQNKWKFQKSKVIISIPSDMKVIISENARNYMDN